MSMAVKNVLELTDDGLRVVEEALEMWIREHTYATERRVTAFDIKREVSTMIQCATHSFKKEVSHE